MKEYAIEFFLSVIIFVGGIYIGWYISADHYKREIAENQVKADSLVIKQQEKNQKELDEYLKKINRSQGKYDEQIIINRSIGSELARLRVSISAGCRSVPGADKAPADQDGTGGILSNRMDESFAKLQERAFELFQRCDQLNTEAVRLNGSL